MHQNISIATEKNGNIDLRRLRAANAVVSCQIWLKIKLIQAFMHVINLQNEEDPIKFKKAKVATTLYMYIDFSDNSIVSGGIRPKF